MSFCWPVQSRLRHRGWHTGSCCCGRTQWPRQSRSLFSPERSVIEKKVLFIYTQGCYSTWEHTRNNPLHVSISSVPKTSTNLWHLGLFIQRYFAIYQKKIIVINEWNIDCPRQKPFEACQSVSVCVFDSLTLPTGVLNPYTHCVCVCVCILQFDTYYGGTVCVCVCVYLTLTTGVLNPYTQSTFSRRIENII